MTEDTHRHTHVSDSGPPVPSSLIRDGDFRRLWVGQTASQLGEHASLVVLPLFAVLTLDAGAGAGAGQLGALRAVGQAPILLLSPALMALSPLARLGRTLPAPPEIPVPSA